MSTTHDLNNQGELGETIAKTRLIKTQVFSCSFLGDKWPSVDYLISTEKAGQKYIAFVQVKSTWKNENYRKKAIKLQVEPDLSCIHELPGARFTPSLWPFTFYYHLSPVDPLIDKKVMIASLGKDHWLEFEESLRYYKATVVDSSEIISLMQQSGHGR